MKKFLIIIYSVIFSALFLISCNDPNQPTYKLVNQNDINFYFPMKVGNWWKYEVYVIDSLGVRKYKKNIDSVYISEIDTINGKICYKFITEAIPMVSYPTYDYYYIENNNLYQYFSPYTLGKNESDWFVAIELQSNNRNMFTVYDTA